MRSSSHPSNFTGSFGVSVLEVDQDFNYLHDEFIANVKTEKKLFQEMNWIIHQVLRVPIGLEIKLLPNHTISSLFPYDLYSMNKIRVLTIDVFDAMDPFFIAKSLINVMTEWYV